MLKYQTKNKDLMVFLFSWPSDGNVLPPLFAYKSDRIDARGSGESFGRGFLKMRDYLKKLRDKKNSKEELCFQKLHLLCHSMGNYVLESSLQKIIDFNEGKNLPRIFDEIFMCAPDVDADVLEKEKPMGRISELAKRITIYHNSGDLPMIISDYTKGNPDRLGHQGSSRPILTDNKINQVNCTPIVEGTLEHSYYLIGHTNKDIKENIDGLANNNPSRKRKMENILGNSFILT
jgi:esterase/lipase superfamily enzyme